MTKRPWVLFLQTFFSWEPARLKLFGVKAPRKKEITDGKLTLVMFPRGDSLLNWALSRKKVWFIRGTSKKFFVSDGPLVWGSLVLVLGIESFEEAPRKLSASSELVRSILVRLAPVLDYKSLYATLMRRKILERMPRKNEKKLKPAK